MNENSRLISASLESLEIVLPTNHLGHREEGMSGKQLKQCDKWICVCLVNMALKKADIEPLGKINFYSPILPPSYWDQDNLP